MVRHSAFRLDGDHSVAEHLCDRRLDPAVRELGFHGVAFCHHRAVILVRLPVTHVVLQCLPLADGVADGAAFEVQHCGADVPAAVHLAEDVPGGHAHVFEENFVEGVHIAHVDQRADGHAGALHVHQEVGDAAVLGGVRVCAGEHEHPVGGVRAGGPDLLAVEDEVVAVTDGASLEGREVGAGARLTVALAPLHLPREDARKVLLPLLFGAVDDNRRPDHRRAHAADVCRARFGELFVENELFHDAEPGAAVLLRPGGRDPALGGELLAPGLHVRAAAARRFLRGFVLRHRLRAFVLEEGAHFVAPGVLSSGVVKVHRVLLWPVWARRWANGSKIGL